MVSSDWFWEGNVQKVLCAHLEAAGWAIISVADTATYAHGTDIEAAQGSRRLLIEMKGYPSKYFQSPAKQGQIKVATPATQAPIWYAQALLKVIRLQNKYPDAEVAIGLPDFPLYRKLITETRAALAKLNVQVFW